MPDSLFNKLATSSAVLFNFFMKKKITDGSISPDLVPITKPFMGPNPREFSMLFPSLMADMLQPFPK